LKVQTVVDRIRSGGMAACMGVTSTESPGGIHGGQPAFGGPVLRHTHGHLFKASPGSGCESVLRIDFKPAPMVWSLRPLVIHRLARTEGEEIADLLTQPRFPGIVRNGRQGFGIG